MLGLESHRSPHRAAESNTGIYALTAPIGTLTAGGIPGRQVALPSLPSARVLWGPMPQPLPGKHHQKTVLTVFALGAGEAVGKDAAFELTAAGSSG